jgi:hypothetical protein
MMAESLEKLQVLKLKCSEKITDKAIEQILISCPNLEELSLFSCKKIKVLATVWPLREMMWCNRDASAQCDQGTAFKALAKRKQPCKLRKLNLSYCELSKKASNCFLLSPHLAKLP